MSLHPTLIKAPQPGQKDNRIRNRIRNTVILLLLLLGVEQFTLLIREGRRSLRASSADYDIGQIRAWEYNYYASHHRYATLDELRQTEHGSSFQSDGVAGYHLQIRLISPQHYDVVAWPGPPFPF